MAINEDIFLRLRLVESRETIWPYNLLMTTKDMWEEEGGGGGTYGFFCRKITKMSQVENTSKDPARSLFFLF